MELRRAFDRGVASLDASAGEVWGGRRGIRPGADASSRRDRAKPAPLAGYRSNGHGAIRLQATFVQSITLVPRVLGQKGVDVPLGLQFLGRREHGERNPGKGSGNRWTAHGFLPKNDNQILAARFRQSQRKSAPFLVGQKLNVAPPPTRAVLTTHAAHR